MHRVLAFAAAALISALALWYFTAHGWLLYYGDAESHLNIARRLTDNATPGIDQLGSPWLPVPHLAMAPFAAIDSLWRSGLAGSIPAAASFAIAAMFLFSAVLDVFQSYWSAWTAMLVFLFNPNGLYLQSTPMSEPFFALVLCALLYFTVRFTRTQNLAYVVGAGVFAVAGTWTRYDGWFLLPFCAVFFFLAAKRKWLASLVFCGVAAVGPLTWLFYNWWCSGNALDFFNGPSSAKAIQGGASYPGLHDWRLAWLYYRTCVRLVLGPPLYWILVVGSVAALVRRTWWPIILLAIPPAFYIWNMHSGDSPIFMPELWPHSWYNTRYGLAALPLAAFAAAAITRSRWGIAVLVLAAGTWAFHRSPEDWIIWKESERNSLDRRAWTQLAADYLRVHVKPGEHIMTEFNDTIGVFRYSGIPLVYAFHPGNSLLWQAAVLRPDLGMRTTWVLSQRDDKDALSNAVRRSGRYVLVKSISVSNARPVDIFRYHDPQSQHYEYPFYQGPRREE